jgi:hypothetical protein
MIKKTDWYPSSTLPSRRGWYDVRWPSGNIRRRYWNGREWVQHPRGMVSVFNLFNNGRTRFFDSSYSALQFSRFVMLVLEMSIYM